MAQYVKRPVVIEAIRWFGGNTDEILTFAGARAFPKKPNAPIPSEREIIIETPDGDEIAKYGDWVIKDEHGFYPCKPDIFAATYHEVRADEQGHVHTSLP